MFLKTKFRRFAVVVSAVSLVLIGSNSISAERNEEPDYVQNANKVIQSNLSQQEKTSQLDKLGWEAVETRDVSDFMPRAASGCGSIDNQTVLKHVDGTGDEPRYVYLIQANWDFADSGSCTFDATSDKASDAIGIAVVDGNGDPVGVQGEYAYINVRDNNGDLYPYNGAVSGASGSGMVFTVDDYGNGTSFHIGGRGEAWFYVMKPSGSGPFYIQSVWRHTWTTTTTSLTGLGITYGASGNNIGLNTTWSTTTAPQINDWADSSYVAFN